MYWQPGPAFWQAHFRDCGWIDKRREGLSKRPNEYLEGIARTGEKVLGWLKFRELLKNVNLMNYDKSKLIEPYEEYKLALDILNERELEKADLRKLLSESKEGFFESLFTTSKSIRKNVAKRILRKRAPKFNKQLFPNFYGTPIK